MANRFAAGLSKIAEVSGKAPAAAAPAAAALPPLEALAEAVVSRAPAPAVAPSRAGKVVISGYYDPAVRQQLAILSIKQGRSQAAMLAEAMNLLFERYNEAPIARG